jgi:hypothetical protein
MKEASKDQPTIVASAEVRQLLVSYETMPLSRGAGDVVEKPRPQNRMVSLASSSAARRYRPQKRWSGK